VATRHIGFAGRLSGRYVWKSLQRKRVAGALPLPGPLFGHKCETFIRVSRCASTGVALTRGRLGLAALSGRFGLSFGVHMKIRMILNIAPDDGCQPPLPQNAR